MNAEPRTLPFSRRLCIPAPDRQDRHARPGSQLPSHTTGCTAELPYLNQGGACGATGRRLRPASAFGRPGRPRADPTGQPPLINEAHRTQTGAEGYRLPRRSIVQLAGTASRRPLGPSPRRSAPPTRGPGAHSQGSWRLRGRWLRLGTATPRASAFSHIESSQWQRTQTTWGRANASLGCRLYEPRTPRTRLAQGLPYRVTFDRERRASRIKK
jgi:hypothetical protein